jgi:hypothetical protein
MSEGTLAVDGMNVVLHHSGDSPGHDVVFQITRDRRQAAEAAPKGLAALGHKARLRGLQSVRHRGIRWAAFCETCAGRFCGRPSGGRSGAVLTARAPQCAVPSNL